MSTRKKTHPALENAFSETISMTNEFAFVLASFSAGSRTASEVKSRLDELAIKMRGVASTLESYGVGPDEVLGIDREHPE